MKTCVIMQPVYLPWLGYFDLIEQSDVFVFLDHVQFSKQGRQSRNTIRSKDGEILLSMPVLKGKTPDNPINEVRIDHSRNPLKKHLNSIQTNYRKSKNYDSMFPEIESIYSNVSEELIDLNVDLIKWGCQKLSIDTKFEYSSTIELSEGKVENLIAICQHFDCDHYLSTPGSKEYIDENNIFKKHGIDLTYHEFSHPNYQQLKYPDFISHLSFIDYLFNM
jgi:hypothetical protein